MSAIKSIIGFGSVEESNEYYKVSTDKPINYKHLYNEYYRDEEQDR